MNTGYLTDGHGRRIDYAGVSLDLGPLPAFVYFALSGEESLHLHPYNSPVVHLSESPMRIFSITLPAHGEGYNKFHAMQAWADLTAEGTSWLEDFFQNALLSIHWLFKAGLAVPDAIALGGLSRGGFIAAHLAARLEKVKALIGFAPLTRLSELKEFTPELQERAAPFDLETLIEKLLHVQHTRFYIGNHDSRVSTDACYRFIRLFAEKVHEKHIRQCHIELMITHSIGHKGHGTAPSIFEEGARWIKQQLLER